VEDPGVAAEPAMDDLPVPEYADYFSHWPQDEPGLMVPFEGSRGCWWGQKQHCVFCSLNHSIHYRSKSADRLFREIVALSTRHPGRQMFATDDILDMRMMDTLTSRLAALPERPRLYYSLKSNIRKDQLQALARAGVNAIQPGVESFADEVLTQMRKGVTGLRNVQMLKWSRERGMRVSWSILYGFPFDQAEYYARMAEWLPALTHLPAPRGLTDVRIQRYSPLYSQAEHFGVRNLRPRPVYAMIHKVERALVDQLAYNFDWDPPEDQEGYIAPLRREVLGWMAGAKAPPVLAFEDVGDGLVVADTRPVAARPVHRLSALERAVCLACDHVAKRHQIEAALREDGLEPEAAALDAVLDRLVADRLILQHDGFNLFLACEVGDTAMDGPARALLAQAMAGQGRGMEPALAGGAGAA
jgi:ribosomal peptide maturation radical SAM protein 1